MADTYVPQMPVQIMPVEVKRNCIVVDGKTYCEDEPGPTGHDIAILLVLGVIVTVYIVAAIKVYLKYFEYHGGTVQSQAFIWGAVLLPVITLILWLI